MNVSDRTIQYLEEQANEIRRLIIEMLLHAGSGHSAGPLGLADIFSAFYFYLLSHDPKHPDDPNRDRLILSNGHTCPVRYAAMALAGYFPIEELQTLRQINSRLQGHPHRTALEGLETTSGPLGEGLSQAIGMAMSALMDHRKHRIYCIASDGEHDEGNTWEAVMLAAKNKLHNLTLIIDRNNIQIDGFTEEVMPLESLKAKYEAFNWHVMETDGNSIRAFIDAINEAKAVYERPTVIIAHTIPGKGVPFMEFDPAWHGKTPDSAQAKEALKTLRTLEHKIEVE